jgi:hypothetical protein
MNDKLLDFLMSFGNFLVWTILLIVGIIFLLSGKLNGAQFVELLKTVTVALFGVHSVLHYSSMVKANLEAKTALLMSRPKENKNDSST